MQNYRLEKDHKLNNRYQIIRCIGQGGFGITYMAEDKTMEQYVVIKEYFPVMMVSRDESLMIQVSGDESEQKRYEEGMKRFLSEAQVLASLFDIQGVVKVLDYFKENGTAYIVMEYVKGISLRSYLERASEEMSFERVWEMMQPVMKALEMIHKKGLLHRDINPDNLMIEEDGTIKLLDFGSAREYFLEQDREKTMTILVKNGYAPPEQYERKGKQGPWTDIYALCATMYEMMTGCMPPGSKERQVIDELYSPSTFDVAIEPEQEEKLIKHGMALEVAERFQSIKEMREAFTNEAYEKKKKNTVIIVGVLIAACVAMFSIFWSWYNKDYVEVVRYAGNYERGSQAYDEFINIVEDEAIEAESYAIDDTDLIGWKYVLQKDTVQKIGLPGNDHRLAETVDEVLEILKDCGYVIKKTDELEEYIVYEEPYGTLRTSFNQSDLYVTEEGYELEIIYDVIDRTIFEMYVSMQEGEPRYCPFVCDLMDGLKPEMKFGDKSEDEFYKLMSEYSAQYDQGSNSFYGYQDEEIIAFFRKYKNTGDKIFVKIKLNNVLEIKPQYNW